jgi:hypothetical protein
VSSTGMTTERVKIKPDTRGQVEALQQRPGGDDLTVAVAKAVTTACGASQARGDRLFHRAG